MRLRNSIRALAGRAREVAKLLSALVNRIVRSSFWPRLWRASPLILSIVVISAVASWLGWFDRLENTEIDSFLIVQHPRVSSNVVNVAITDGDYATLFGSTSPLSRSTVQRILSAIATGGARVIGVDIDTSDTSFRQIAIPRSWPPIVWAADAQEVANKFQLATVLGGKEVARDEVGVAVFPVDSGDDVVRRYWRTFPVAGSNQYSLPTALATQYCALQPASCDSRQDSHEHEVILNYTGERYDWTPLSAGDILAAAASPAWAKTKPLAGKAVLLGGTYRSSRDFANTPLGRMSGLYIVAQAVQSEIDGGGVRPTNQLLALGLDMLVGVVLVFVNWVLPPRGAIALGLFGVPVLAMIASFLAFSTFAWWLSFVPMTAGLLMHEVYGYFHRGPAAMNQPRLAQ